MSHDIEIEKIPGLPGDLPDGERVLWQGRPTPRALARATFKTPWLLAYFALFAGLRLALAINAHEGVQGLAQCAVACAAAAACLGVLYGIAWLHARATIYTITSRRVVLRIGVAIPMTWNIPFKRIASADVTSRKSDDGDIVLTVTAPNRIAWLHLWPHAQPGHLVKARPTFRALAEPARVAALLADAVSAWAADEAAPVVLGATDAPASNEAVHVIASRSMGHAVIPSTSV